MPKAPAHRLRRRPPFFPPVPLRARSDGWTEERQCGFLAQLYITGSAGAAARSVGMSRASAYRLRKCDGAVGFAHAWDTVLSPPGTGRHRAVKPDWRKVTTEALLRRVESGLIKPLLYRGVMVKIVRKPDNSALLRLLRRGDTLALVTQRRGSRR